MIWRNFINQAMLGSVLCLLVICGSVFADETERRRIDISLTLFPRIIAVDNHFREKLIDGNKAKLVFIYDRDREYVEGLVNRLLEDRDNIGGMGVLAEVASIDELIAYDEPPTAVFLAERLNDDLLEQVMSVASRNNRLVYSPFSGDVERGVTVGVSVTHRIKPFFNMAVLRESKIVINALLMKVSKRYE